MSPGDGPFRPSLLHLKVVVRCKNFAESFAFYAEVLGLRVVDRWEEPQGTGCVFSLGEGGPSGHIEIYEMAGVDERIDPAFASPFENDKIDLQLRTESVDAWVESLRGRWPIIGPEILPWGHRWIRLRDPDNLLIAIYEEAD